MKTGKLGHWETHVLFLGNGSGTHATETWEPAGNLLTLLKLM